MLCAGGYGSVCRNSCRVYAVRITVVCESVPVFLAQGKRRSPWGFSRCKPDITTLVPARVVCVRHPIAVQT
ncbi:hypothetical protein RR48_07964 [Papilio machaon]|uniref:Uncharacterized protein n=1 Tax=Papilio machaon TaxID=76193 RepID=A0A194QNM4_PAPMA|nr:hypothetical protein RR48_07964 [Papilio machaon]